ncbi:hypothetical protein ACIGEZ_32410 [Streptomyces sp. NPDC085481]|uniref:hypothetical protein n=1 Tax=Streptomyces sp. NPDC085481 TaxID=3365727 RepID=UPI0037D1160C
MDWYNDERLAGEVRSMTPVQRRKAAILALRRLQQPLTGLAMPQEWGVDSQVLKAVLRAGESALKNAYDGSLHAAVEEILRAPIFADEEDDLYAEGNQELQLEVLAAWINLCEVWEEMREGATKSLLMKVRQLTIGEDAGVQQSLSVISGEAERQAYLDGVDRTLAEYGLGYFGTRNIEIERRCNDVILGSSDDMELWASRDGREVQQLCDEFSSEILSVLQDSSSF